MFLSIGDPHFKCDNTSETNTLHSETVNLVRDGHFDFVVVLGDIMHTHNKADLSTFIRACEYLEELSKYSTVFVLIGNHDRINNKISSGDDHFFYPLKGKDENLIIVDTPVVYTILSKDYMFLPYMEPGKLFEQLYKYSLYPESCEVVFGHHELYGSEVSNKPSDIGDIWPEDFPLFISGHIHHYHKPQKNIIYVGTPFMQSYGCSSDKTISIFDDMLAEQRIKLDIPRLISVRIPAKDFCNFEYETDCKLKIKIEGSNKQKSIIVNTDKYKGMISRGIKISFYEIKKDEIFHLNNKMKLGLPFKERIKNKLNTETTKLFHELF